MTNIILHYPIVFMFIFQDFIVIFKISGFPFLIDTFDQKFGISVVIVKLKLVLRYDAFDVTAGVF